MSQQPPKKDPRLQTEALLAQADEERASLLGRAGLMGRARLRGALREIDLENGDPGARRRIRTAIRRGAEVEREREKARVPAPTASPDKAVLHGRVVDRGGLGLAGATVLVRDQRGREAARVETVEVGYYAFCFPPEGSSKAKAKIEARVFLEVCDAHGRVLHRGAEPVAIASGQVVYREIDLSGEEPRGGRTCADAGPTPTPPETKSKATKTKERKARKKRNGKKEPEPRSDGEEGRPS